ncbi:MAG TPA: VWA domain-containing protein, partial [Bacteroidota bacterium]|nr:VWA domain-containing protein [Bacteroidota bacterium]
MRFRYSRWRPDSTTDEQRLQQLVSLFSYLTVQTNGDVEEALEWLKQLAEEYGLFDENMSMDDLIDKLREMGLIEDAKTGVQLTGKGIQRIRQDALREIFTSLKKAPSGSHETPYTGSGVDRLSETKKYRFGDQPTNIDLTSTLTNAFRRDGIDDFTLKEEDLEVYETEHQTTCATVLMIDISHSMILYGEDRITPAKQVALALTELILTRYPKDTLRVGTFGDEAREIAIRDIPYLQVGPFHTNTRAGLEMAQTILESTRQSNRQIFMVTDGKPTAITENGEVYKNPYGFDPKILAQTLEAASACRRAGITITTFMLAQD